MKRPWNIVDVPIYSLASYDSEEVNMNICSYVSAVSMKPKLYMIAIDYQTKTFSNLSATDRAVLQLLHQDHAPLVSLLGKKTGNKVNKAQRLEKKELLTEWNGYTVLKDSCAYISLKVKDRTNIGGDHELFYFEVEKSVTKEEQNILMFQDLVQKGIIL